ncbi:3-dehydroquinate synthase [Thermodesulfobacteriota bacterium]
MIKTLHVHGKTGDSAILVGETLSNLAHHIPDEKVVLITDTDIWRLYQMSFPKRETIVIGTGEDVKTLDTVRYIYEKLMALEADRSTFLVGIGGGVVCDITGFVASTYLRGLKFGFVATTLLAQVDASVGGKNGVNVGGYKNMVGVFNQPEFVICDMNLLTTLPKKEILSGFGEIVKHAVIGDSKMFEYLEKNSRAAMELDSEAIIRLVYDSVTLKSAIVTRDEKEGGERRKLNFGHTFGHAIEKTTGISHGEAVSAGMAAASRLSVQKGLLAESDEKRITALLNKLKLPTGFEGDSKILLDALRKDKKRKGDAIYFVLLCGIGNAMVQELPLIEIELAVETLF